MQAHAPCGRQTCIMWYNDDSGKTLPDESRVLQEAKAASISSSKVFSDKHVVCHAECFHLLDSLKCHGSLPKYRYAWLAIPWHLLLQRLV